MAQSLRPDRGCTQGSGRHEKNDLCRRKHGPLDKIDRNGLVPGSGPGMKPPPPDPLTALQRTYEEMVRTNVPGTDQFFHCLATCRAVKNGSSPGGIRYYTNQKEYLRDYPLGRLGLYGTGVRHSHAEMIQDIRGDQAANEQGISCPAGVPCNQHCAPLLDNLPARLRPFMRRYRTVW